MDEEVTRMLKRLLFAVIIAIIFIIPVAIFVYNKFDNSTSDILAKMKKEKVLIFINGYKCYKCREIKKVLDEYNIKYYEINKDLNNQNYKIILDKIKLSEEYAPAPSLILVEDGKLSVNINDFNEIDLSEFFYEYEVK